MLNNGWKCSQSLQMYLMRKSHGNLIHFISDYSYQIFNWKCVTCTWNQNRFFTIRKKKYKNVSNREEIWEKRNWIEYGEI